MSRHVRPDELTAKTDWFRVFFDRSQAMRRIAHNHRREALKWEAENHHRFYADCRKEANRLWRDAKWYLHHSRQFYGV